MLKDRASNTDVLKNLITINNSLEEKLLLIR